MKKLWAVLICMAVALPAIAAEQVSQQSQPVAKQEEQLNNGQDITKPLHRLDLRYMFTTIPDGYHQDIFTLRSDLPVKLSKSWLISFRVDVPFVYGDVKATDNKNGENQFAIGDVLTQILPVHLISERVGVGLGAQFIWPTASNNQSGTGKCQVLPMLGVRISLPEISNGTFMVPNIRYVKSFAGNSSRSDINGLRITPMFNFMLPKGFFLDLFPDQAFNYNFERNQWDIVVNFMLGKMLTKSIVLSMEFYIPVYRSIETIPYNFMWETRVGFFF